MSLTSVVSVLIVLILAVTVSYYVFSFKPRQEFSLVLLQSCIGSLDLRVPEINQKFFTEHQSDEAAVGIWACETGAKSYRRTGEWRF